MKDCIIIGSGIAGISAALTLKANGKTFQIFGNAGLSEKISKAESIRNYPAFYNVTGQALVRALQDQIEKEDIEITTEKDLHLAKEFSLFDSLLGPNAGVHIGCFGAEEVVGDVEELGACATAHKVYLVYESSPGHFLHGLRSGSRSEKR